MTDAGAMPLQDHEVSTETFLDDVIDGLSRSPRWLPSKYLYDAAGSKLFDQICELDEYYLTRTEISILEKHGADIARRIGANALVAELGSGSSLKTRLLLDRLESPAAYVPIDISREHLLESARTLQDAYPNIPVLPVCADYMADFDLPAPEHTPSHAVVYFPGSTIGNLEPDEAVGLLKRMAKITGEKGGMVIGVDLRKNKAVLEAAYDDSSGVTARFTMNYPTRMNRELGADFDLAQWKHRAVYNEDLGRIEIGLQSLKTQTVTIGDHAFDFEGGELIRTEHSYKFSLEGFADVASRADWDVLQVWTDARKLFSVQYLETR
ncbi:MAG: L-histidine N(alpha)-methyltransferase [Planctomycetota bacterium]